jgi:NarL family two-component system response regulator LiaR
MWEFMVSKAKIRVLLVDDSSDFRETLCGFLETKANLEVVGQACNGQEALTLSKELTPDVVIMDVNMPDMDGIQATREISQLYPDVKVIAYSLELDELSKSGMFQAGACAYLSKTEKPAKLVQAIEAAAA